MKPNPARERIRCWNAITVSQEDLRKSRVRSLVLTRALNREARFWFARTFHGK